MGNSILNIMFGINVTGILCDYHPKQKIHKVTNAHFKNLLNSLLQKKLGIGILIFPYFSFYSV